MIRVSTLLLSLVLWVSLTPSAIALEMRNLGKLDVDVASTASQEQAFQQGMRALIIRLSGQASTPDKPAARELIANAGRYIQSFNQLADPARKRYQLSFNVQAVTQYLQQAGLPLWGINRPQTLVWLLLSSGRQQDIVSESDVKQSPDTSGRSGAWLAESAQSLQTTANARGLPVVLPLMDMTDKRVVTTADIRAGFMENIKAASSRYDHDAIVSAFAENRGSRWEIRWQLDDNNSLDQWQSSASSLAAAVQQGMNTLVDRMAQDYALTEGSAASQELLVEFNNVNQIRAYADISNYVDDLSLIKQAVPVLIDGSTLIYRLTVQGNAARLERSLLMSGFLRKANSSAALLGGTTTGGPLTGDFPLVDDTINQPDQPRSSNRLALRATPQIEPDLVLIYQR